jgi:hypothetical protein
LPELNQPPASSNAPTSPIGKLVDAFRFADFRVLWSSTLFNQMGQGMQQVALGWLVLELTDSAGMVGVVFAVRSSPNFLVGFAAGSITDRLDRRLVMRASVLGMAILAVLSALLLYLDALPVWGLLLVAFLMGVGQAFYMTARLVYVYDIVGEGGALHGIAIMSLAQRLGGVLGALAAGALIHWWAPAVSFLVMAGGYAAGLSVLLWLREAGTAAPEQREPMWLNMVNYYRALRSNRVMVILMITTAGAEFLGFSHQVLLPVLAKEVLHLGPAGLGVITSFRFLGGAFGVLVTAALGEVRRHGVALVVVLVAFGGGEIMLSQAGALWSVLLFVTFINVMASVTDILHQNLLQLSVPNQQRGRAMGSWLVGTGVGPVGHIQIGFLSGAASPGIALLANGITLAVLALAAGIGVPRLRRL